VRAESHVRAWYGAVAPVSKDGDIAATTDRVPTYDRDALLADGASGDAEDDFEGDEQTMIIVGAPYELKPRYTGRSSAREKLDAALATAIGERRLSFVVLVGEPGMGKSRTVKELARGLKANHPQARFLAGVVDDAGPPFDAFARLLAVRFGVLPGDSAADSREKIVAGIAEVLPAARVTEVAHLIAHLMRVPFDDSPVVSPLVEAPKQLEVRTFLALRRFFAADAEAGPLVLCIENLELVGTETINLLHYLVAGLAGSPVMVLGTARANLFERHPSFGTGDVSALRIDLGALSPSEAEALFRELCAPLDEVPERLVAHAKQLGGSPRALFELVRLLVESEVIARSGAMTWTIDKGRLASALLPRTYEELVTARLRVMDPADRRLIEMAAAIGETFWLDAVVAIDRVETTELEASKPGAKRDPDGPTLSAIASAGDPSRTQVTQSMVKLVERDWLIPVRASSVPGEREYRFAYPNLWQVVYAGTDATVRRRFHRVVAQWFELRPEGRGPIAQEDVARHLELAGDTAAAAARYRRAAEAARANYFNERAIRLYNKALACSSDEPGMPDFATRIHLWHDLGSIYELIGDFEAALGAFERMLRLSWVVASKTKAAVAFNKMGRVWRRKGDLKLALEYLQRGQELFEQASDARGIAGSLDDIGKLLHLLGRYDEAFEKVTEALTRRGKGGDRRSIASSLSNLGVIQQDRGRFLEAYNCHKEALELRRLAGDRWGVIVSRNNLAVLANDLGDYAEARAGWTEALQEAEGIGALPLSAMALSNLGELALTEGKIEEARSRLEDALEIAEDIDDRQLQAETNRLLARLENGAGNTERARELAHTALEIAAASGLREKEGVALVTLGEVFSSSLFDAEQTDEAPDSAAPAAEHYFRRGLDLLRQIGNEAELGRGLEQYGRYKVELGHLGEGRDILKEALLVYTKLGMKRGEDVEKVLASIA
jgi:tetratricopeptide (TPR) repeat protein